MGHSTVAALSLNDWIWVASVFAIYAAILIYIRAVALDVEHGWGEEFVENLLEMIQFDAAYSAGPPSPWELEQLASADSTLGPTI
jgi:hypothetical protein